MASSWFDAIEKLVERMRALFPSATISEEEMRTMKAHFIPILQRLVQEHALMDMDGLQDAYKKVVLLVARSHPVYAYKIESASGAKKHLAFLDSYFSEAFQPTGADGGDVGALVNNMRERIDFNAKKAEVKKIESLLKGLAWRVGFTSLCEVHQLIRKRRASLALATTDELDRWLLEVFIPMLSELNSSRGSVVS